MIGLLRTSIVLTTLSFVYIHALTIPGCVEVDCAKEAEGSYHPSCSGCNKFIQCSHGINHEKACRAGLVWNNEIKTCAHTSNACPGSSMTTAPSNDNGYTQWCHSDGLYVRDQVEETECLYDMKLNKVATLEETILSPNHKGAGIACIKGVTWGFRDITNKYGSTRRQLYTKGGCCGKFRIAPMM